VLVPGHRLEVAQLQQVHDRHFMRRKHEYMTILVLDGMSWLS